MALKMAIYDKLEGVVVIGGGVPVVIEAKPMAGTAPASVELRD